MFLTRMPLNPRRRAAVPLLSSPQAMHAAVLAGFADPAATDATDAGRVLWRIDRYRNQRVVLYVVSPQPPDFTHLVEQAGWPTTETWLTRPYAPLLDTLAPGQRWQFRLTANPVHAGRRSEWASTRPMAHVTAKQQEQWLLDRTAKWGFRLASAGDTEAGDGFDLAVVERSTQRFRRGNAMVTLGVATFEGQLEVIDAAALRRTVTHGVGRAKSYGCGLLTLARPGSV